MMRSAQYRHGVLLSVVVLLYGCRGATTQLQSAPSPAIGLARTADDSAARDRVLLRLGSESAWAVQKREEVRSRWKPLLKAHGDEDVEVKRLVGIERELIGYHDSFLARVIVLMLERRDDPRKGLQDAVRTTSGWPHDSQERIGDAFAEFMANTEASHGEFWPEFEKVLEVVAAEIRTTAAGEGVRGG